MHRRFSFYVYVFGAYIVTPRIPNLVSSQTSEVLLTHTRLLAMRIYSAGSNAHGQLAHSGGDDSHIFQAAVFYDDQRKSMQSNLSTSVRAIATGANHTLVLLESLDGETELWGCGDGSKGQLGEGVGPTDLTSFHRLNLLHGNDNHHITHVAACWETSFIVTTSRNQGDTVWSLGSNAYGLRGIGKQPNEDISPSTISVVDLSKFMQAPTSVFHVTSILGGPNHVVVKLLKDEEDGACSEQVLGWGASRHGQLGPTKLPFLPSPIKLPVDNIDTFAIGMQHTVFRQKNSCIIGLGSDKKRQLRGLTDIKNVVNVGATWSATFVVIKESNTEQWAIAYSGTSVVSNSDDGTANDKRGTGEVPSLRSIQMPMETSVHSISGLLCGSEHVLLCLQEKDSYCGLKGVEVWGWGWNEHGNLGLGHTIDTITPTKLWPTQQIADRNGVVQRIHAGYGTSWVVVQHTENR